MTPDPELDAAVEARDIGAVVDVLAGRFAMPDGQLAVNVTCLDCSAQVLRAEASPGETVELPGHDCEREAS